ncbi:MAG TPA: hypothetical protein VK470_15970 [Bacteroidota bacterium]|nr:hypothetical protein [Bacteroidota bacterium]
MLRLIAVRLLPLTVSMAMRTFETFRVDFIVIFFRESALLQEKAVRPQQSSLHPFRPARDHPDNEKRSSVPIRTQSNPHTKNLTFNESAANQTFRQCGKRDSYGNEKLSYQKNSEGTIDDGRSFCVFTAHRKYGIKEIDA